MIKINNRDAEWKEGLTVKGLLVEKSFTFPKIMVTINQQLIEENAYESTPIHDGDDVKVLHLMAGG